MFDNFGLQDVNIKSTESNTIDDKIKKYETEKKQIESKIQELNVQQKVLENELSKIEASIKSEVNLPEDFKLTDEALTTLTNKIESKIKELESKLESQNNS